MTRIAGNQWVMREFKIKTKRRDAENAENAEVMIWIELGGKAKGQKSEA